MAMGDDDQVLRFRTFFIQYFILKKIYLRYHTKNRI